MKTEVIEWLEHLERCTMEREHAAPDTDSG
jgi:hypothetical protein